MKRIVYLCNLCDNIIKEQNFNGLSIIRFNKNNKSIIKAINILSSNDEYNIHICESCCKIMQDTLFFRHSFD